MLRLSSLWASVVDASGEDERRELRILCLVDPEVAAGQELTLRIETRVRRPEVQIAPRCRERQTVRAQPARQALRHVVRDRYLAQIDVLRVVDDEVAQGAVALHLHEQAR